MNGIVLRRVQKRTDDLKTLSFFIRNHFFAKLANKPTLQEEMADFSHELMCSAPLLSGRAAGLLYL
jgi:hypothetical protein